LIAAHSVNDEADGVILDPHYDLSDEPPDGALASRWYCIRRSRHQGERKQAFAFELGQWVLRLPPTPPARLGAPALRASARPALLQFGRDQTGPCSRPSSHLPYFFVYF